jgi:phage shock protein C
MFTAARLPDAPPMPEITAPTPRQLRRSADDRMVAGVAGGIGEYFDIDPVLVRIGFVAATLLAGTGLVLYPIAWLVVPGPNGRAHLGPRRREVAAS